MHVGRISTSHSYTCPGASGSTRSCGWYGCHGLLFFGSRRRCDARSQPLAIGVLGSVDPMNVSSLPLGSNTRTTRKRSASVVDDEMNSLAAMGPVISVGRSRVIEKSTPEPSASYWILARL